MFMASNSEIQSNISISMIRETMEDIPQFPLPLGFLASWYQSGNEKSWVEIQRASDNYNKITLELFYKEFGYNQKSLRRRQLYLFYQKQAIGTATAWFDKNYRQRPYGRLHWVAVIPSKQGLGLSNSLLAIVCERIKQLGHKRTYLTTSPARIPAINLYLKFGFKPEIVCKKDLDVWLAIQPKLKYPLDFA
jgi:GNAT superfamily N-acetyltransferase